MIQGAIQVLGKKKKKSNQENTEIPSKNKQQKK